MANTARKNNSKQKETTQKDYDTELKEPLVEWGSGTCELLLKELDERHRYSRFIAHGFLMWHTFFVSLNLFIMGVSLAHAAQIEGYRKPMVVSFLIFNFLGIFTAAVILRGTQTQQTRIKEIIYALTQKPEKAEMKIREVIGQLYRSLRHKCNARTGSEVRSPYPHYLFALLPMVFALAHVVLIVFWSIFWFNPFNI